MCNATVFLTVACTSCTLLLNKNLIVFLFPENTKCGLGKDIGG